MGDRQDDDLIGTRIKYDAPISDAQAHRQVAPQPLDLVPESERINSKSIERALNPLPHRRIQGVELPRSLRSEDDGPNRTQAGFLSRTTLCSVSSAASKNRRTPRAAWRMRCSFSTSARRT